MQIVEHSTIRILTGFVPTPSSAPKVMVLLSLFAVDRQ